MTPVAMNPSPSPFLLTDQIEDQHHHHQLFVSPLNQDSSHNSLSSCTPSFFHFLDQTQTTRETHREFRHNHDQEELDGLVFHGGSSSHQVCDSSFNSPKPQQVQEDQRNVYGGYKEEEEEEEEESKSSCESAQWMPSKMRLMRKMMIPNKASNNNNNVTPNIQTREQQKTQTQKSPSSSNSHRNNNTTRVCADCNTTSTPLWRGGPKGPKSLCNACGIRQRKARRALMAEAGNGSVSCRMNSKEKKGRTNHFVGLKNNNNHNKCNKGSGSSEGTSEGEKNKNVGFKDLAFSLRNNVSVVEQVFPADEVAQAALLLMDLSYASVPF